MLPLPQIPGVRIAHPGDLPRISVVAAASFFWSPSFRFQRPRFRDFPQDTIASYYLEYEAAIQDPTCLVLVTEDMIREDEAGYAYEALRDASTPAIAGHIGIVGVCSINLRSGSFFLGRSRPGPKGAETPRSDQEMLRAGFPDEQHLLARHSALNLKRDQNVTAVAVYNARTRPAKLRKVSRQANCKFAY